MSKAQQIVSAMVVEFCWLVAFKDLSDMRRGYCLWPPDKKEVEKAIAQLQPEERP